MTYIRKTEKADLPKLVELQEDFCKALGVYDPEQINIDVKDLERSLFEFGGVQSYTIQLNEAFDSEIIGFVHTNNVLHSATGKLYLHGQTLFIAQEHRHKGHGLAAMKFLFDLVAEGPYHKFKGECRKDNKHALNLYKNLGATTDGGSYEIAFSKKVCSELSVRLNG